MGYAYAALLVSGLLMVPVAVVMFPQPSLGELRPSPIRMVEPPQNDYEGSVSQTVARVSGRARKAVSVAYRGVAHVARHVRQVVWERPCSLMRRHRRAGEYYDTQTSGRAMEFADVARQRDFVDDGHEYESRHSIEKMLAMYDFNMRETVNA